MAEKGGPGEGSSASNTDGEFLSRFKDVSAYSSQAFRSLLLATKASNNLPNAGDDYDYYSSFEAFRDIMDLEGKKLLEIIQNVIRYHGLKGNVLKQHGETEVEEKFDTLVDVNDQLLERVGSFLDEAAGLKKQEAQLVVASVSPKQISGSWNKKAMPKGVVSNYRLLSAKNIQRPQAKFKEKIDNTTRQFVPKIKYKPNAMKPLPESLVIYQQDDKVQTVQSEDTERIVFPHPYQYELDHLTHPTFMLEKADPQEIVPVEDTPLQMVADAPQLERMCEYLKTQKEVAVDLEHHSYRTYQGITCLMQISTRSRDYVVDTLALWSELHILNEVFTDPQIVKVFHGADMDVEWLQRDFGLYVVNMFDTGQAARVLNLGRYSLAYLLQSYCSVEADKQFQLADWRIRPLPEELLKYAREDTHYLLYIYDKLRNQLLDHGNSQKNFLMSTLTRSTQICARKYQKPNIENRYLTLYMRSKKVLNAQQMYALKELDQWRDALARQEDESTGYVLPNHMMLQIADILPKDAQGILACCKPIPPLVRQNMGALIHIIRDAREVPLTKPVAARKVHKPSAHQHPKYKTSPFNCPHDASYQEKRQSDQQPTIIPADASLVAEGSSMFDSSKKWRVSHIDSKVAPQLTVFAWSPQVAPPLTAKQVQAAAIRASFVSPFEKYLPSSGLQVVRTAPTMKITSSPASSTELPTWKLKPNTPQMKPEPISTPEVTSTQPLLRPEEEEEGVVPFSQMVPKKKKKKAKDKDAAIIEAINMAESIDQTANEPLGAQQKKSDARTVEVRKDRPGPLTSTPFATKEAKKRKKEKITVEQLETDGFEGHDYSKSDFKIFTEPTEKKSKRVNKKGKKKEFDPDSTPVESDYKAGPRPRLTGGKKSQTFGRHTKQEGTSWPKR